jgi:hypothetical protein
MAIEPARVTTFPAGLKLEFLPALNRWSFSGDLVPGRVCRSHRGGATLAARVLSLGTAPAPEPASA